MNILLVVLAVLAGLYLLFVGAFYLIQEKMLFYPETLDKGYQFKFNHSFEEHYLKIRRGVVVNALLFKVEKPRGVVLFHHGNARNINDWAERYPFFTDNQYDVLFYDYRTFGKSTGPMSELGLHRDARAAYDFLLARYPANQIIQYGISLGSGIATKLAKKVKSPLLILETPYVSMLAMANKVAPYLPNKIILKYPIRSDYWIKRLYCPVFAFHGTNDELVPFNHSLRLKKMKPAIDLTIIEGGMHNDLWQYPVYEKKLNDILTNFPHSRKN